MVDAALKQATGVPLGVAEQAREVMTIAEDLGPITSSNMQSDLTAARALARAAIQAALANVNINLESMGDSKFRAEVQTRTEALKSLFSRG